MGVGLMPIGCARSASTGECVLQKQEPLGGLGWGRRMGGAENAKVCVHVCFPYGPHTWTLQPCHAECMLHAVGGCVGGCVSHTVQHHRRRRRSQDLLNVCCIIFRMGGLLLWLLRQLQVAALNFPS